MGFRHRLADGRMSRHTCNIKAIPVSCNECQCICSPSGRTQWHRRGRTRVWLDGGAVWLYYVTTRDKQSETEQAVRPCLDRVISAPARRARPQSTEQAGKQADTCISPVDRPPRSNHGGTPSRHGEHGVFGDGSRGRSPADRERGSDGKPPSASLACTAALPRAGDVAPFGGSPGPCDQEMEGLAG